MRSSNNVHTFKEWSVKNHTMLRKLCQNNWLKSSQTFALAKSVRKFSPNPLHIPKYHFWAFFHLSFCSSFSVFLDLLPWKQTQERALLVQGEEQIKRQERSTERALPQQENEETLPKVSIPIPEDHKSLRKCHLYSSAFPSPRIPFMMSFLVVLALAVWWLVFLWSENRVRI